MCKIRTHTLALSMSFPEMIEPFVDPDPDLDTFRTGLRSKHAEGPFGENIVDVAPCQLGKDDYFKNSEEDLAAGPEPSGFTLPRLRSPVGHGLSSEEVVAKSKNGGLALWLY
jgi:hypothetical protein